MADLIDKYGNPVELTDEHGNPVQLTDERGKPMQLTGVATSPSQASEGPENVPGVTSVYVEETHVMSGPGTGVVSGAQLDPFVTGIIGAQAQDVGIGTGGHQLKDQLQRSSSSSSSSDDDGQDGRRKKGIKEKLKETFGVGKQKHAQEHTPPLGEQHHEHEKKSVMEKIKEKFPGHHHTPSQGK